MTSMTTPLFNFETDVDMSRGPVDGRTAPSGVQWTPPPAAPVSGMTPAAAHASATGAMAAEPAQGTRIEHLLRAFLAHGRLTIAEAALRLDVKEGSICGPWRRLEHELGWIRGTGTFFVWTTKKGRRVRREYHELTDRGREMAEAQRHKRGAR